MAGTMPVADTAIISLELTPLVATSSRIESTALAFH
jgi:hypothetical protein